MSPSFFISRSGSAAPVWRSASALGLWRRTTSIRSRPSRFSDVRTRSRRYSGSKRLRGGSVVRSVPIFVTTTACLAASLASIFPRRTSMAPPPYASAVSKRVNPISSARTTVFSATSASTGP